ncbi:hypothetical protein N9064_00910 [bacterium]|nr:hypothetical protein [bacterium]
MSNIYNEQELEDIQSYVLEQDRKGLLEDEISYISFAYNLHPDDDRDEILEFITESILYEKNVGGLV